MQTTLKAVERQVPALLQLRNRGKPSSATEATETKAETKASAEKAIHTLCSVLDELDDALHDLTRFVHSSVIFWYLLGLKPFRDAQTSVST